MDLVFPVVCPICGARTFDEVAQGASGDCIIMPEADLICPKCFQQRENGWFEKQNTIYHDNKQ